MKITIEFLISKNACAGGVEMFLRFPSYQPSGVDLIPLIEWALTDGGADYVRWLLAAVMTPEQATLWAIACARRVCFDQGWVAWADGWVSGDDRSAATATTARAAAMVDALAAKAAAAAMRAAEATTSFAMAWAARWAARSAARWAARWAVELAHTNDNSETRWQVARAIQIIEGAK